MLCCPHPLSSLPAAPPLLAGSAWCPGQSVTCQPLMGNCGGLLAPKPRALEHQFLNIHPSGQREEWGALLKGQIEKGKKENKSPPKKRQNLWQDSRAQAALSTETAAKEPALLEMVINSFPPSQLPSAKVSPGQGSG